MMALTIAEMADNYNRTFPKWPPLHIFGDRWLYGVWVLGNDYHNRSRLYGAYPPNYLKRVVSMFPSVPDTRIMHLFSGSLTQKDVGGALRMDINNYGDPNVLVCNAEETLPSSTFGYFDLVLSDPPYAQSDADRYGCKLPNKRLVLRNVAEAVRPGGYLCWLDCSLPMYRRVDWNLVGTIGIVRSTNHRVRLLAIFQRTEA